MASVIRLLLINKQLGFSVRIKQALEQIGGYEVTPFTSADTALEILRKQRFDISLVDFTIPSVQSTNLVQTMRSIQPDLAIIASPDLPEVISTVRGMHLNGIIDVPCSARELLPIINKALAKSSAHNDIQESQTMPAPLPESSERILVKTDDDEHLVGTETLDIAQDTDHTHQEPKEDQKSNTIEFVLSGDVGALRETFKEPQKRPMDSDANKAVDLFQQLSEEEPPMPDLEESGTITDLKKVVSQTDLYDVAEKMLDDYTTPKPPTLPEAPTEESDESTPAEIVLKSLAINNQREEDIDDLLDDMLAELSESYTSDRSKQRNIPAWVTDVERYIREPDFLDIGLPEIDDPVNADTTSLIDEDSQSAEIINRNRIAPPPPGLPEMPAPKDADTDKTAALDEKEATQLKADLKSLPPKSAVPQLPSPEEKPKPPAEEDPQLAQLALSLTQATLESAAEATLLALDNKVLAYAGDMPLEDIAQLHETITGDWDAKPGETRLRFATLAENGQDYMLFSRLTESGYTLSMIFSGTQPLRNMRQQGDKLLNALFKVKEKTEESTLAQTERSQIEELYQLEDAAAQVEDEALESTSQLVIDEETGELKALPQPVNVTEPVAMTPPKKDFMWRYTYLWLLRNPERALSQEAAFSVVSKLDEWLSSIGWSVEILQVYEDYVYLMADVPDEIMADEIINDLKDFSARVVAQVESVEDVENLWADSYFMLNPGRELHQDEIQRFINFERRR